MVCAVNPEAVRPAGARAARHGICVSMGCMLHEPTKEDVCAATARVGRTLRGQWRYDRLIDVGSMATVYAATHQSGTRGAIKVLNRKWSITPEIACSFLREEHPHAVRILGDEVDDDGNVCVVMELLEGGTLCECAQVEGGRLGAERVLRVMDQVLEGLIVLHDAGIVHRDIKPANLFLTTDGQVKILDFGIARLRGPSSPSVPEPLAGFAMGTPEFMSPEQACGRWDWVDAQSDLWSLGATAFTLLSGQFVHREATLTDLLAASADHPARSLSTVLPDAPPSLVRIVDRALKQKRASRWRDARAMRVAVHDALAWTSGVSPCSAPCDQMAPASCLQLHVQPRTADCDRSRESKGVS
jgi:serine/threonine-protein kinase